MAQWYIFLIMPLMRNSDTMFLAYSILLTFILLRVWYPLLGTPLWPCHERKWRTTVLFHVKGHLLAWRFRSCPWFACFLGRQVSRWSSSCLRCLEHPSCLWGTVILSLLSRWESYLPSPLPSPSLPPLSLSLLFHPPPSLLLCLLLLFFNLLCG